MATFTQEQCDSAKIKREKRLKDGVFKDWVIRLFDENGNYYEYIDSSAPENRTVETHKGEIHAYLKANCEFLPAATNIITSEPNETV